ncbi:MAG: MASE1 domain-containing protein [Gemmatimonadales bacterium]
MADYLSVPPERGAWSDPRAALRRVSVATAVVAVYFIAAKLGLRLAFVHPSATAVWPPTGITLAGFLLFGYGIAPAIFAGAFLRQPHHGGHAGQRPSASRRATRSRAWWGRCWSRAGPAVRMPFEQVRNVFRFAVLAAGVSTAISATIGVTSLALGGFARWEAFGTIWLTWWLGDAAGNLVVAPALLLWAATPRLNWRVPQVVEAVALLVCLAVVSVSVFSGLFALGVKNYPIAFLCIPALVWVAVRFGPRETATVMVLLSAVATWGTLRGFGPFHRQMPNDSLLLLQGFMCVMGVTKLILAAEVSERRRAGETLRQLSVSDPLTGLANYRELVAVLDREIQRSGRTGRPFALLFLDLDGLKALNDRHGHLVGSRALCRLADALRASCRAVDTAARFGGDEFAVVLPETDEVAACEAARRIAEGLRQDLELPRISASLGVAVYPRDGRTAEALLGSADRLLYAMKAQGRRAAAAAAAADG